MGHRPLQAQKTSPQQGGTFSSKGTVDSFPNVEAYHYADSELTPTILFQHQFVSEEELTGGKVGFLPSTRGMMGIQRFNWEYGNDSKSSSMGGGGKSINLLLK